MHLEISEEGGGNQKNEQGNLTAKCNSNIRAAVKPKPEKLKPKQETSKQLEVNAVPLAGWVKKKSAKKSPFSESVSFTQWSPYNHNHQDAWLWRWWWWWGDSEWTAGGGRGGGVIEPDPELQTATHNLFYDRTPVWYVRYFDSCSAPS